MIDAYITELGDALRGSGRVKADLLAEARDGLVDAAEAYEAGGLDWAQAERRAVEDFGEVRVIAPGYQAELGLSLGRRTMLLLAGVLFAQHLVWDYVFPPVLRAAVGEQASLMSHELELAAVALGAIGGASMLVALLAGLACGLGARFLRGVVAQHRLTRTIGVFAVAVSAFYTVSGLLLTFRDADWRMMWFHAGWTVVVLVVPMLCVATSARRTLAAA